MLIQNDNFFELIGNLTQLKYMIKNILERHGTLHPKLNKEDYKNLKDKLEIVAFPKLYDLKKSGKTFIGEIETYLLYIKETLESEKQCETRKKIDPIVENRLRKVWKETKVLMKKYELDYDYSEDVLGDI